MAAVKVHPFRFGIRLFARFTLVAVQSFLEQSLGQ
jgi:hypothetical protein